MVSSVSRLLRMLEISSSRSPCERSDSPDAGTASNRRRYRRRFEAVPASGLSERSQGDRELLISSIRSSLLTLETIRPWQKDPDSYSSGITASAFVIMERNFALPDQRLRRLIEREQLMPAALQAAVSYTHLTLP